MVLSAAELGYEEAAPSVACCNPGHGEATPTADELGYGDEEATSTPANRNENLGYGEGPPPRTATLSSRRLLRRMGHRASFGRGARRASICGAPHPPPSDAMIIPRRRMTMDHHQPVALSSPSHHTMAPRRSSMTAAASSFEPKPQRRVSFGGSDAINHVPKLYNNSQEKKDMWYDTGELNVMRRKIKAIVCQEAELDETEDCWRGLEAYIKRHHPQARCGHEEETCNQIMLQLQQQQRVYNCTDEKESREDGRSSAQPRLRTGATRTGNKQAAEDAAEALAIYMETMDSEQVRACFESARGDASK